MNVDSKCKPGRSEILGICSGGNQRSRVNLQPWQVRYKRMRLQGEVMGSTSV